MVTQSEVHSKFSGVLTPVIMPYQADYKPDTNRLIRQCKWMLTQNVGLAVFGTNSEGNSLSIEEKIDIPEPDFIKKLNHEQKAAVKNLEGPLLVLSGAGTGKTKVLTTRLANIILNKKAKISEILSVTFTNKAAYEMKKRVEEILQMPAEGMFIGTFHSIGVKILRKHSEILG